MERRPGGASPAPSAARAQPYGAAPLSRGTAHARSSSAVLSAASWLTLPELATSTAYQAGFAHEGDASVWG